MLDNILSVVKEVAASAVKSNADVPTDKKDLAVETATDAIGKGLMDNIGDLAGLLGGSGSSSVINSIQETIVNSLMKKVGLNSDVANSLVSALLPAVLSALKEKIDSDNSEFSLESVLGALGGDKKGGDLGDMLGSLGKLFG